MRVPKSWIPVIARRIVDTLFQEELIVDDIEPAVLREHVERIVLEELMVEDRLNDEVRRMLSNHENDIDRDRLDYRMVFDLTKQKLIRDRGIII